MKCQVLVLLAAVSTTAVLSLPAPASAQVARERSPRAAQSASLWGTVLPAAAGIGMFAAGTENPLVGVGLYFGPALGYWTGGVSGRGWGGIGLRLGIGTAGVLGAYAFCGDGWSCENEGAATAVLVGAIGGILTSAIHDISTVDDRVAERNERLRAGGGVDVSVAPTVSPAHGGMIGLVGRIGL
jgi:hypothetical protein